MKTLVTGATGLVGTQLVQGLERPTVLSRDPASATDALGQVDAHAWDPLTGPPPAEALRDAELVFHLAGEPVADGRWSETKKQAIRDSRVIGTRNLVEGMSRMAVRPRVLVAASAIGIYGDRGDDYLDERSPAGTGFLAEVCADWEREAMAATELGIRVVCARIGIVLSTRGGALDRMMTPFKLGVGGRLGSGRQWMSWIHLDDLVGLLLHASRTPMIEGPMNAVSPTPATNAVFTRALGHAVHRPAFLPIPRAGLRLMFGRMSGVLLSSQRVLPHVAQRSGYSFTYPQLDAALAALLAEPAAPAEAA